MLRFNPETPAVALDDSLTKSQTDARAWELVARVQPLKNDKDALEILRLDSNAIVSDRENPFLAPSDL